MKSLLCRAPFFLSPSPTATSPACLQTSIRWSLASSAVLANGDLQAGRRMPLFKRSSLHKASVPRVGPRRARVSLRKHLPFAREGAPKSRRASQGRWRRAAGPVYSGDVASHSSRTPHSYLPRTADLRWDQLHFLSGLRTMHSAFCRGGWGGTWHHLQAFQRSLIAGIPSQPPRPWLSGC